jgi:hypothetical protein
MQQKVLPYKYEAEKSTSTEMTALGGFPVYLDLIHVSGLRSSIEKHLGIRRNGQGWTDSQVIIALILLNLSGGEHVEDLRVLESDKGFCRLIREAEHTGLTRKARCLLAHRFRKKRQQAFPSPSSVFRYLTAFHTPEQEDLRKPGKAFIPASNRHLSGLPRINKDLLAFLQDNQPGKTATLDMDATLIETTKQAAQYCYKGYSSYQPLNTWWAEPEVIVHTEFRDGNVPAAYEQLRVFQEALSCLPSGIESVRLRSDTAGYQHILMRYCEKGQDKRFGRIEFAIGCDVTPAFKRAVSEVREEDWHPLYKEVKGKRVKTHTEWAEVCFVPNKMGFSKNSPVYRYLAKRTPLKEQKTLPGLKISEPMLPFPTLFMEKGRYKVFGIATNMDWEGNRLINWHHGRCGKSEQAHAIMKDDLAGGVLPSEAFGVNAAWWWVMVLAFNLNSLMKRLVLPEEWKPKRLKAIRFYLLNLPGRVMIRSRQLFVRISHHHPCFNVLCEMRKKISILKPSPG